MQDHDGATLGAHHTGTVNHQGSSTSDILANTVQDADSGSGSGGGTHLAPVQQLGASDYNDTHFPHPDASGNAITSTERGLEYAPLIASALTECAFFDAGVPGPIRKAHELWTAARVEVCKNHAAGHQFDAQRSATAEAASDHAHGRARDGHDEGIRHNAPNAGGPSGASDGVGDTHSGDDTGGHDDRSDNADRHCGGCAVEAATTSVRSELNDACAIAVSNAITPLRNELTPLREQNVAFAMEIEELERLHSEADEEHRDLRHAFELLQRQTPASPVAPPLDMGPDRRAPKFGRCGEALGVGFASYTIAGADGLPKSVALQEASPALAQLVAGGRMAVQVLLRDGSTPTAMADYYYFDAQVRGVAVETGGAGIGLYVSATGLRYVLPVVDFSSWEFGLSVASAWPKVTRHGMDRTAPNLAVADGHSRRTTRAPYGFTRRSRSSSRTTRRPTLGGCSRSWMRSGR